MALEIHLADFREALIDACLTAIGRVAEYVGNERVYALAVYTTRGLRSFASAMATEESFSRRPKHPGGLDEDVLSLLNEHPDLLAMIDVTEDISDYLRVTADEWEYIGLGDQFFEHVNVLSDNIHRVTDDMDWGQKKSLFLEQILLALTKIRSRSPFAGSNFRLMFF